MTTTAYTPKTPAGRGATRNRTATRHIVVVIAAAALVYAFSLVHGQWSPMHQWNRAFGDAAVLLLALTMSLGAVSRLIRPTARCGNGGAKLGHGSGGIVSLRAE